MKIRLILSAFLLIQSIPLGVFAQPQALPSASRISAVTVYADRAQVTRSASLALKAGTNLVTLSPLPLSIFEESLRAEGTGTGRARIAGLTVKNVFLEQFPGKRLQELEQEIQALNRKVESIEARRKALTAQRAFIDSIRVGWGERISKDLSAGKPSMAELSEAAKFVGDGVAKIEEGLYDADAAKKPLLDQIAALQKELELARVNRGKEVRAVEVAIEAERAMQFNLTLTYLVGQAHWEPVYDLRLAPDGTSAELAYRAQVWQRSGEDWPGVKLSLSSATPAAGVAPPELFPWRISFYQPPPPRPIPMMRGAAKALMAPMESAAPAADQNYGGQPPEQQVEALPQFAQVAEGQTSVLFNVAQPVDIPADGTRAASVISMEKVPVSAEFVAVPKLSPRVFLKSEVVNSTAYPLLAGEVNIFNDTVFTGKSRLKTVASGEKFDLYFGADDQLKVKREVSRVRKQAGILSSNRLSYACSVELENFKKRPVNLTLMDQLPLAGNAEIKVALEDARPKPDETKQDGTVLWKLKLEPGEKKKVTYDIVIEYPKGRELTGAD